MNEPLSGVDVVLTTWKNPVWAQRSLLSLLRYTNHAHLNHIYLCGPEPLDAGPPGDDPRVTRVVFNEEDSCLTKLVHALRHSVKTPFVLFLQDDALILPGQMDWLAVLAQPFERDGFLAMVSPVVSGATSPHMTISQCLPPGFYWTSNMVPICLLARTDRFLEITSEIHHDMLSDQELPLITLRKGYRMAVATHVSVYHEGMQANVRFYGHDAIHEWRERIRLEILERYPAVWIERMQVSEMIPMDNYYHQNTNNTAMVRMT